MKHISSHALVRHPNTAQEGIMTVNDPNRGYTTPRDATGMRNSSSTTWGMIAVAAVLIIGALFYFSSGSSDRTASNAPAPATTQTSPMKTAPAPAPVTPAPATPKQ
jgi:hypothetical protein